jgi:hypothetical protein
VPRFQLWHELAILALIGMEITWVAMWFRIFSRTAQPISFWRSLAVFAGMSIGVFAFAQLLNLLRIRQNLRRGALGAIHRQSAAGVEMVVVSSSRRGSW